MKYENLLHLVADVAGAKRKWRSRDIARVILRAINLVADQSNQFLCGHQTQGDWPDLDPKMLRAGAILIYILST